MAVNLSFLLEPLENLLSFTQRERHFKVKLDEERKVKRKEALQAIFDALHATRKYQELSGGTPNRETEYELSRLWATASIKAEGLTDPLRDASYDKACYWASVIRWPQDVVISKGIDLESMEKKYKALLDDSTS